MRNDFPDALETGVVCLTSGMSLPCLNYNSSAPKHMAERLWTCGGSKGPCELGVRNNSIKGWLET